MMIRKIANLDPDTYSSFCFWLREEKKMPIGKLIKEDGIEQDRMLTLFFVERSRRFQHESN